MQPGDSVRLWPAAGRFPGVEAEVVVVAAGGNEQDVTCRAPSRHVSRLGNDVEAEHADIEVAHPVDIGGPQMHVADAHARIDRVRGCLDWRDVALGHEPKVPRAAAMSSTMLGAGEQFNPMDQASGPIDVAELAGPRLTAVHTYLIVYDYGMGGVSAVTRLSQCCGRARVPLLVFAERHTGG
jgi:hypothetical protein